MELIDEKVEEKLWVAIRNSKKRNLCGNRFVLTVLSNRDTELMELLSLNNVPL